MAEDEKKTRAQRLLSKITDRPIVAYIVVGATILGAIASFTSNVETIFGSSEKVLASLAKADPKRPPSLWIRLGKHDVKNESGVNVEETPRAGHLVQVTSPPITYAIADSLPLKISSLNGGTSKPRKLPVTKPYDMYYETLIPEGTYQLLDVDVVEMPSGRATSKKGNEPTKVIYLDSNNNEIHGPLTQTHMEVWGRIENLKSFGIQ